MNKLGFQKISENISFVFLIDKEGTENLLMLFEPDEGFGSDNPTYLFRVPVIVTKDFKKINGVKKRIYHRKYEFYGTQIDNSTGELWDIYNDTNISIGGGYELNCPKSWAYKIIHDISHEDIEMFLDHISNLK